MGIPGQWERGAESSRSNIVLKNKEMFPEGWKVDKVTSKKVKRIVMGKLDNHELISMRDVHADIVTLLAAQRNKVDHDEEDFAVDDLDTGENRIIFKHFPNLIKKCESGGDSSRSNIVLKNREMVPEGWKVDKVRSKKGKRIVSGKLDNHELIAMRDVHADIGTFLAAQRKKVDHDEEDFAVDDLDIIKREKRLERTESFSNISTI